MHSMTIYILPIFLYSAHPQFASWKPAESRRSPSQLNIDIGTHATCSVSFTSPSLSFHHPHKYVLQKEHAASRFARRERLRVVIVSSSLRIQLLILVKTVADRKRFSFRLDRDEGHSVLTNRVAQRCVGSRKLIHEGAAQLQI